MGSTPNCDGNGNEKNEQQVQAFILERQRQREILGKKMTLSQRCQRALRRQHFLAGLECVYFANVRFSNEI